MTSTHYTANIKVEKVTKNEITDRGSASHGQVKRDVVETVNLTVKAQTLERLKTKIAEHTGLLDEEDL